MANPVSSVDVTLQMELARKEHYKGLDPLDLKRCMAEFKEPHQPFRIGFPEPGWMRCDRVPTTIALEATLDKLTKTRGAMSLCRSCAKKCKERRPECVFTESAPFKAAFKLGGHAAVVAMIYDLGIR